MAKAHGPAEQKALDDLHIHMRAQTQILATKKEVRLHLEGTHRTVHGAMAPVAIATALHVGARHHRISSCPKCFLGYHCNNWVPTPCGHTYHPHCLFSILHESSLRPVTIPPSCVACKQVFHPDWLVCWGYDTEHHEVKVLEKTFAIEQQREKRFSQLLQFYTDDSAICLKHVEAEKKMFQHFTVPGDEVSSPRLDLFVSGFLL